MTQWDYDVIRVPKETDDWFEHQAFLQRMGQEGWELVTILTGRFPTGVTYFDYYVKRPHDYEDLEGRV